MSLPRLRVQSLLLLKEKKIQVLRVSQLSLPLPSSTLLKSCCPRPLAAFGNSPQKPSESWRGARAPWEVALLTSLPCPTLSLECLCALQFPSIPPRCCVCLSWSLDEPFFEACLCVFVPLTTHQVFCEIPGLDELSLGVLLIPIWKLFSTLFYNCLLYPSLSSKCVKSRSLLVLRLWPQHWA